MNVTGGTVDSLDVNSGTMNLSGGSITGQPDEQISFSGGTLNVYGSGLSFFPSS